MRDPRDPYFEDSSVVGCPSCSPAWVTRLWSTPCEQCRRAQADYRRRRRAALAANPAQAFTDPWATDDEERTFRRGA